MCQGSKLEGADRRPVQAYFLAVETAAICFAWNHDGFRPHDRIVCCSYNSYRLTMSAILMGCFTLRNGSMVRLLLLYDRSIALSSLNWKKECGSVRGPLTKHEECLGGISLDVDLLSFVRLIGPTNLACTSGRRANGDWRR